MDQWHPVAWILCGVALCAFFLVGAIIAGIYCTDKTQPHRNIEEWKDGRIAPYSHIDDV